MAQLTPDETLLGLLMSRSQHGYQLLDCFQNQQQLGRIWKLSTSQLYAVLKRLETQHLILGEEISSPDAPSRTVYTVTEAGRQEVMTWLTNPNPSPSVRRVRVEFLSRLYVAQLLHISTSSLISHQQKTCQQKLRQLNSQLASAESEIANLSIRLEIAQITAILEWLRNLNIVHT